MSKDEKKEETLEQAPMSSNPEKSEAVGPEETPEQDRATPGKAETEAEEEAARADEIRRFFPRFLFRPGGTLVCKHNVHYSEKLVNTPEEAYDAMDNGWLDDFGAALAVESTSDTTETSKKAKRSR